MNPQDLQFRFDELCAGRAMGDLSADEARELAGICESLGLAPDASLDTLVATIDATSGHPPLPPEMAARLHAWADEATAAPIIRPPVSIWKKIITHPLAGWAAAAAVLLFAGVINREPPAMDLAEAEKTLRAKAPDLIEREFEGLGEFTGAAGSVIWSDLRQQGFMLLRGIPANDPRLAQYQLWIVAPTRDADSPVDGGVFDIPRDATTAIIPITAKLPVQDPQAFVITREQPGGVVKSKQEHPVALAKR
jgi:hypothetical protein